MLFIDSIIKNTDNSGIISGRIIHIYKNKQKKTPAKIKQLILIASQKTEYRKISTQKITKAYITKTKKQIKRKNGHFLAFARSGMVVLYENDMFKGTIIKGPIAAEIRFQPNTENIINTVKAVI